MRLAFDRAVGNSQGPWLVYKTMHKSYESAYKDLITVLKGKINNLKKPKRTRGKCVYV